MDEEEEEEEELRNKNPPTPCLWQAPASTQKTKRKTRPAIRRSARWRASLLIMDEFHLTSTAQLVWYVYQVSLPSFRAEPTPPDKERFFRNNFFLRRLVW